MVSEGRERTPRSYVKECKGSSTRVTIPKGNQKLREFFEWMFYRLVKTDEKTETYEGAFAFRIDFDAFKIPRGEREKFYRAFEVKDGFKTRYRDWFDVTPIRKRRVNFVISERELELYNQYLREYETTISEHLRLKITGDIMDWMRRKKKVPTEKREEARMFG